jgi:hypothetical protein
MLYRIIYVIINLSYFFSIILFKIQNIEIYPDIEGYADALRVQPDHNFEKTDKTQLQQQRFNTQRSYDCL